MCHCGAVVKELLTRADNKQVSTPGDVVFCFFFFVPFFLCLFCFLTLFFILACFPLFFLLTLLIMHIDQYLFYAQVRSFSLEKGFQELLICILDKAYGYKKT